MEQRMTMDMELLDLQAQYINKLGITSDQFANVIDGIINADLADKNYRRSDVPLIGAADKQKEAKRIINNYHIALEDFIKSNKKDKDANKAVVKFSIIVSAAKAGLSALGMPNDEISKVLGLANAISGKGGK